MKSLIKKLSRKKLNLFLIFCCIGFLIYANSFKVPFFADDNDNVVNNIYIKDWKYLPKLFSENLIAGAGLLSNYWRPLLLLTFSIDYHLFGLNKYWFHFVDISLHIINAYLIFIILQILLKRNGLSFLVALIFLIHPIQIEAVTCITGRADPLYLLFLLLSIYLYLKSITPNGEIRFYYFSLLSFIASLLSKEIAIILPVLLVILEISFNKRWTIKSVFLRTIAFFVLAAIYFLSRLTILNFKNILNFYDFNSVYVQSALVRILTFLKVLLIYFGLLSFPHDLYMERDLPPVTSFEWSSRTSVLILIVISYLIIRRFSKNKIYFFGFGLFFIALAPASGIFIPINAIIYEHWLYLPMVGFFLAILSLGEEILKDRFKRLTTFFLLSYLIFLAVTTVKTNFNWKDPITFYNHILKYNHTSIRVWNNLGMAYADANELDKAIDAYKEAIALDKESISAPPHHNLANAYLAKGMKEEAIKEYRKAIDIDERFIYSYNNLLALYLQAGRHAEAIPILEKKLKLSPNDNVTRDILNTLYKLPKK
ncbi:MAG: tetratricopeptide repeat protein [Candidatus Omnitrophica bacterium]|nr:tetratricopeptide repeat protein [Candidatus Omnitrophota bacterium]